MARVLNAFTRLNFTPKDEHSNENNEDKQEKEQQQQEEDSLTKSQSKTHSPTTSPSSSKKNNNSSPPINEQENERKWLGDEEEMSLYESKFKTIPEEGKDHGGFTQGMSMLCGMFLYNMPESGLDNYFYTDRK